MTLINNTIIGCRADGIKLYSETSKNTIANNVIASVGAGRYITFGQGAVATQLSNVKSARPDTLGFVDIARADFRLTKNSLLVNRGSTTNTWSVLTDLTDAPRRSPDVGAYGYQSIASARTGASERAKTTDPPESGSIFAFPTLCREQITFKISAGIQKIYVYDLTGKLYQYISPPAHDQEVTIATALMQAGSYFYILETRQGNYTGRFMKQ